ncbi:arsenate reductase/protein-tyrosine-phosphatase family protein [Salininema proteolyticum]|uniref:Phosphotyrosine protein phosphatase n=1 Tax=Salininema proteolyticum TaxID=1607685 RepID=A0ABV8TYD3_9ACTN
MSDDRLLTVLHVCTGNICRSPMSERILDGLTGDDVYNHGAGTSPYHEGEDMQANSHAQLEERGYDVRRHHARALDRAAVEMSDLILVATDGHREFIASNFPEALDRTFLVRQIGAAAEGLRAPAGDAKARAKALMEHARSAGNGEENLADPWGLGMATYERIADQLETALKPVARVLDTR